MIVVGEFCGMIKNPQTEIKIKGLESERSFTTIAYVLRKSLNVITGFDFENGTTLLVSDSAYEQLENLVK